MDDKEVTVECSECGWNFIVTANEDQIDIYGEVNCECPNCNIINDNEIVSN